MTKVEELRERFAREGYVEFGSSAWKTALMLAVLLLVVVSSAATAVAAGWIFRVLVVAFLAMLLWGAASHVKVTLTGKPRLRLDRAGLTLNLSSKTVVVGWPDVVAVVDVKPSRLIGPTAGVVVTPTAWQAYLEGYGAVLRWMSRMNGRTIWIPKTLKGVSAARLLEWLDQPTVEGLIAASPARDLLLAPTDGDRGPLYYRNGHGVVLSSLPLREETRRALTEWAARADTALTNWEAALGAEGAADADQAQRFLDVLADESRLFAAHLAQELGTTVTVWLDSADVA